MSYSVVQNGTVSEWVSSSRVLCTLKETHWEELNIEDLSNCLL